MSRCKRLVSAVELWFRRWRAFVLPAHWRTYRELAARPVPATPGTRWVCLDFTCPEIDNETGRYLFALVRGFQALGLRVAYRDNFHFIASMRHRMHKRMLVDDGFCVYRSLAEFPPGSIVALVTDRTSPPEAFAGHVIRVSYEPRLPRSKQELSMRYPPHPEMQDQLPPPDRVEVEAPRDWRVFFAGDVRAPRYDLPAFRAKYGKLTRVWMLRVLERALGPEALRRVRSLDELQRARVERPSLVWADGSEFRIPPQQWLQTLSRADFFLACPGVRFPLCHNLIESMAMGSVPVLEHPEHLDPPLEDGVNCLTFRGETELVGTVRRALALPMEEVTRLRRGAMEYYLRVLAPGVLARQLLARPSGVTLLLLSFQASRRTGT